MSESPLTAAYCRALKKDWESTIEVQVTYREGGRWVYRYIRRAQIIRWIMEARQLVQVQLGTSDWYERHYKYKHTVRGFCKARVFAIRFESGAIYDFILATSIDKAVRSLAWR